jgi:cytochrome c peroxidase
MSFNGRIKPIQVAVVLLLAFGISSNVLALQWNEDDYELKLLGKFVFFDNISNPSVQACVSCHAPRTGGTGNNSNVNLHQVAENGADRGTVGSLKPPTNLYATFIKSFNRGYDECTGPFGFCGGNFWNGRSVGDGGERFPPNTTHVIEDDVIPDDLLGRYARYLGPVADQALNPFPNDVEQNVPDGNDGGLPGAEFVCRHVENSNYGFLYEFAWGEPIDCDSEGVATSFQRIAIALSAYQGSSEVNSFSSKRDIFLRAELTCACAEFESGDPNYPGEEVCNIVGSFALPFIRRHPNYKNSPGKFPLVGFTKKENWGHDLFYGLPSDLNPQAKNAQCTECHVTHNDIGQEVEIDGELKFMPDGTGLDERYTNDSYHTIGTPWNPEITNPEIAPQGLAGHTGVTTGGFPPPGTGHIGLRKVPTLRNVDKRPRKRFVKAYGANGWFKSLESIMHFYNTAQLANCDPATDDNECRDRGEVAPDETTAWAKYGMTRCEAREEGWTEAQAEAANCWPAPEFPDAPVPFGLFVGNLDLEPEEEAAIVAYMKTFTDLITARAPRPYELAIARLKHRRR